ncbi:long-chain fatty acid--CoA ligase [Chloroflexota bacterium]
MQVPENRPWFKFWPEGLPHHLDYPEVPLYDFLVNSARKYPNNIAFGNREGYNLTYQELDTQTNKLACALSRLGMVKGDRALVFLPNSPEFVVAYYGILKAGGTVVPTNPLYKAGELNHHISDSGAVVIITDRERYPSVEAIRDRTGLHIVVMTDAQDIAGTVSFSEIMAHYPPKPLQLNIRPKEDAAAIVYTGGTTGLPKGVMLTHYNLVANAIQNTVWLDWSSQDIIIGLLPFSHSWGASTCINSVIYCGSRVIVFPRFNAQELLETIEKEKATLLYSAASLFTSLVSNPLISRYDLSSLKYVKAGAMPIPPEIKRRWEQVTGVKMILGYGLSEASPETHNCPPDRVKPGTIGIPIFDTDARIMDQATGTIELPQGELGELVIRGPQVMKEYLNQPEDSKEALRDGWLYTGDLAIIDEEGYFCIVDRKKETIIYNGYTIAPAEIEAVIYEHPGVKECAVVGKTDAVCGEIPKAFVVLKEENSVSKEELIEFCAQKLSPYKKIREVAFIDEVPKTNVGKVLRRLLKESEEV